MRQGRRIRVALVAALLLAQIELPAAHGLMIAAEVGGGAAVSQALTIDAGSPVSHHGADHDSRLCPICLALSHARSSIGRLAPLGALRSPGAVTLCAPALPVAAASAFERVSAPPRAPPLRALSLA